MSASSSPPAHPAHLDPSELGTKDYWDNYYKTDLSNLSSNEQAETETEHESSTQIDPSDLPSWFSDVSAPEKILSYLTSDKFPLSPSNWPADSPLPSVLDLGTGNGSLLFQLRTEGEFEGNRMCGIDYSQASIDLSRRLGKEIGAGCEDVEFEQCDILRDDWRNAEWWPRQSTSQDEEHKGEGWDIILDKGTFDAISLSAEEIEVEVDNTTTSTAHPPTRRRRICELYPEKVSQMVKPGGYLLITSCNWTEEEVIRWFTATSDSTTTRRREETGADLEVYGKVKYSTYRFGGQEGQGVASICFRRKP